MGVFLSKKTNAKIGEDMYEILDTSVKTAISKNVQNYYSQVLPSDKKGKFPPKIFDKSMKKLKSHYVGYDIIALPHQMEPPIGYIAKIFWKEKTF